MAVITATSKVKPAFEDPGEIDPLDPQSLTGKELGDFNEL
jgi:hypothetical protein